MSDTTHQRVMNMIARGKLAKTDDTAGMQFTQLSLLRDEAKANVERFQQYGFSSVPPANSEAVVLFVGGGRDHGLVLSVENRASRIRGQSEGEVAMYTDEGDYIVLKRGNQIELATDRLIVRVDVEVIIDAPLIRLLAPVVEIVGNLNVAGSITAESVTAPGGSVPGPPI